MEYAVRGQLVINAQVCAGGHPSLPRHHCEPHRRQYILSHASFPRLLPPWNNAYVRNVGARQAHAKALQNGEERPFPEVVLCNIGNPQSVGQQPLTFPRQVLALCTCPSMLDDPAIVGALPSDVVARAQRILGGAGGGLGAYSESKGIEVVRESVKTYIEERDGFPTDIEDVFLTNGASEGVKTLLTMLVSGKKDGVMIPIPQYPLYSASITALGGSQVGYFLDEDNDWAMSVEALDKAAADAKAKGINLRTLCVINPGNPTGQVMSEENISQVIEWAAKEGVLIMADEVYQTNVYDPTMQFHSFKKVLRSMPEHADKVELVSFHSTSKGIMGECGMRGGYLELCNIHAETKEEVYKSLSVNLCSNLPGQVITEIMVNPPKPGEPSYESYRAEYDTIFDSLTRRAKVLVEGLNSLEGVTCNASSGAMYAFPQIRLPQKWMEDCSKRGIPADTAYCLELLDATGICVVPGSGFGQADGTLHFRTTFLPQEDKIQAVTERLATFHADFMQRYS
jgi:alanine transaminase